MLVTKIVCIDQSYLTFTVCLNTIETTLTNQVATVTLVKQHQPALTAALRTKETVSVDLINQHRISCQKNGPSGLLTRYERCAELSS